MAYNYRAEEKKWLLWKQHEEEQLRELGVDEDVIQRLHTYDWEQFRQERRFFRWMDTTEELDQYEAQESTETPIDAVGFLDGIEDVRLWKVLQQTDPDTLEMLVCRMNGFSYKKIGEKYGLQEMAVINRISRLRKNLKKIF